jgi:AraC-like DNA-binding protein
LIIKKYIPHPALQPFVEMIVVMEGYYGTEIQNCYPSIHPVICVDISGKHFREHKGDYGNYTMGVAGLLDQCVQIDHMPERVVQVLLKPFGAYRFLGVPLNRLSQWGQDITELVPDAQLAIPELQDFFEDDSTCVKLLEDFLLCRLKKLDKGFHHMPEIAFACSQIKRSAGAIKISELAHSVNMSEGRFRVHFAEKTGLSPKHFCYVEKFNQIDRVLREGSGTDWMDVAQRFNFYDQTHFIKDFKRFFGCTPSRYSTTNLLSISSALGI